MPFPEKTLHRGRKMKIPSNQMHCAEYGSCNNHSDIHERQDLAAGKKIEFHIVWYRFKDIDLTPQKETSGPRSAMVLIFDSFDPLARKCQVSCEVCDGYVLWLGP